MDSTSTARSLRDCALERIQEHWHDFPLHSAAAGQCSCKAGRRCLKPGKHPRIKEWPERCTIDASQVRSWWNQWPDANIGVATGKISGLVVLDFDQRHGGIQTFNQLVADYPELRQTLRVKTGDGLHPYFRYPDSGAVTRSDILPGVDVRGDGGYIISPGSVHASGAEYRFMNPEAEILPFPPGLLHLITPKSSDRTQEGQIPDTRRTQEHARNTQGTRKQEKEWVRGKKQKADILSTLDAAQQRAIQKAVSVSMPTAAGTRHKSLFQFARRLRSIFPATVEPQNLIALVEYWYHKASQAAQTKGFRMAGSLAETKKEFRNAWPRIRRELDDSRTMAGIIEQCCQDLSSGALPFQVSECLSALGYANHPPTAALMLVCWYCSLAWPDAFPLSCRKGAEAVSTILNIQIHYQRVADILIAFEQDGIIECTYRSTPGNRLRASEFRWVWNSEAAGNRPDLSWLE